MKASNLLMLLCGAAMIVSCKNSSNFKALDKESSDTALVAADSIAPKQPKLVKTADISFKVKDVQQTGENIASLTTKYSGLVMHHEMTSSSMQTHDIRLNDDSILRVSAYKTTAVMTVKIPSEKIEDFLNTVSRLSVYVNVRRMDIEDKSLDYLASQLKLNSRKELVHGQKSGRIVLKDANSVLDLKDGLVDEQINNRKIDDAVKYSYISLNFYQNNTVSREVIANDNTASYSLPFVNRIEMAIANGWFLLKEVIIVLINMWTFIAVALMVWLIVRMHKRKRIINTL